MPGRATSERRIYPRHRVHVAVVWNNCRTQPMRGEICDVSAQGVFIVSTTALPDEVGVGDSTHITISTKTQKEEIAGIVRWRGYHPAHQAIGCGIQLDEPSAKVIARLFPVLLDSIPAHQPPDPTPSPMLDLPRARLRG